MGGLWGLSYLLIAVGLRYFSPAVIVLIRTLSGTATLAAAVSLSPGSFKGFDRPARKRFFKYMPLQALVASTLPYLLISWGETRTSVSTAGVLNAATPLFTLVFAKIFLGGEHDSFKRVAGLVLGFIGVAIIIDPWSRQPGAQSELIGSMAVLCASALYGYGFVVTRKYFAHETGSAKVMALGQIGFAAILSIPFLVMFHAPTHKSISLWGALSAVLVLGVIQTGLATLMYHRVVRQLGATASSVVTYVIPLVAVAAGVIFAGNTLSPSFVAGAIVVLIAVSLAAGASPAKPTLEATPF